MQTQMRLAWPPLTRNIIIVGVVLFVVRMAMVLIEPFGIMAKQSLTLSASTLTSLQLWSTLSYGVLATSFGQLFFDLLALYLFGAEVDQWWSGKKWWLTVLAATIVGGLLGALVLWVQGAPGVIGGFGAPVMALIAAYCWQYWDRPMNFFFIELKGKILLGLFLTLDILLGISAFFSNRPSMLGIHLGGLAVGLLVASDLWRPKQLMLRIKYWKVRRNMKLIARTPEDDPRRRQDGTWIN